MTNLIHKQYAAKPTPGAGKREMCLWVGLNSSPINSFNGELGTGLVQSIDSRYIKV